jgi:hypothetical protein
MPYCLLRSVACWDRESVGIGKAVRTEKPVRKALPANKVVHYHYWPPTTIVIALFWLVVGGGLFFGGEKPNGQQIPAVSSPLVSSGGAAHMAQSPSLYAPAASALLEPSIPVGSFLDNDLDNDGNLDSMPDPPAASVTPVRRNILGVLDNDTDHDGHVDGMTDPLVIVMSTVPLLVPLLGSGILLPLYGPPMAGSDYRLALERPG